MIKQEEVRINGMGFHSVLYKLKATLYTCCSFYGIEVYAGLDQLFHINWTENQQRASSAVYIMLLSFNTVSLVATS